MAVPGTGFFDDARLCGDVEHEARMADPFGVHDVELGLLEWWRNLVLDHLHANVRADDILLLLHGPDAPDVEAHRRIELERLATGGRLRIAEHDADLLAQLIDEHHRRL